MTGWIQRKSGKGEIDRAGTALVPWWITPNAERPEKFSDYISAVFNWRLSCPSAQCIPKNFAHSCQQS
jgi:hypothetical protein